MFSDLRTTRSGVTRPRSYCSNTRGEANEGGWCDTRGGGRGAFSGETAGEPDPDWIPDVGMGAWNSSGVDVWIGDAPSDTPPEVNG